MKVYSIDGIIPVIHPTAYVHPTAVLIGNVVVGPRCYVGPLASLRGDFGRIIMNEGSNVQDNCILHGFPESDTIVDIDGHVGHGAILHSCKVGRNALIGMNSVVMDDAVVGENSFVGANSFVKAGMIIPPNCLVMGSPAKVLRDLREDEIKWKHKGTLQYQALAVRCLQTMQVVDPLTEVTEQHRSVRHDPEVVPKIRTR